MGGIVFLIGLMAVLGIGYPLFCLVLAIVLKAFGEISSIKDFMRHI